MRYIWQHIRFIIDNYDGSMPLSHFLKTYLRKHPKLGSRDRKILAEMAYGYYRFGKGFSRETPFEQKIQAGVFLGDMDLPQIMQLIPVAWQTHSGTLEDKIAILAKEDILFNKEKLWEVENPFSEGTSREEWLGSMMSQPRLFIRVRKDRPAVLNILKNNNIAWEEIGSDCLSLPNGTAVDKLLPSDSYVVQDASSQAAASYFKPEIGQEWWDVCAGAGGKSLMLKDMQPKLALTVSDKRENIIQNLKERFKQYGHKQPVAFVADITDAESLDKILGPKRFHNIICDVPCSGSGTWARTPEQAYFFNPEQLSKYASLQKEIAVNASKYLKNGGRLYYITCSVFREENEDAVTHLLGSSPLKLVEQKLINGKVLQADSMFIAVLEN